MQMYVVMAGNLLHKAIATASVHVVFLELDKLQLAKGLENGLQVLFGDIKVNVSDVQAMEWNMIGVGAARLGVARLAVLLSLGELNDDGNT